MEENRRQRRIPFSSAAKVIKLSGGEKSDATLVDVSNYGASLKTQTPLKNNERIKVSISLEKEGKILHSEEVPGTVRWVERASNFYVAGISFDIKINDNMYPVFTNCLDYLKSSN